MSILIMLKQCSYCQFGKLPRTRYQKRYSLQVQNVFTGIVQGVARIDSLQDKNNIRSLKIKFPGEYGKDVQYGASVAINGTCLTVVDKNDKDTMMFDVINETLSTTTLEYLKIGDEVNFERSAKVGDEIGGHLVSGHVVTTARIKSLDVDDKDWRLNFEVDPKWMKYILHKGFIAVDGCSLTVGDTWDDGFCVYLIPETLDITTFKNKKQDDYVNIELDSQTQAIVDRIEALLPKLVAQQVQKQGTEIEQQVAALSQ